MWNKKARLRAFLASWEGGADVDLTDDQKRADLQAFEQLHLDQRMTDRLRWVEQGLKRSLGIDAP